MIVRQICILTALALGVGIARLAAAEAKVTYVDNVLPIFRNACLNCHNPDKKKAGLDLSSYSKMMEGSEGGPVINPGNVDDSLLYRCILQKSDDPKMPPKGDKLADNELTIVKNWIAGFALETASSKPAAAAKNNVGLAVVSLKRPEGPPPMPGDLPLEPLVQTSHTNALVALAASPWAPLVAVGGQKQIILYHTETLEPLGILPFPEGFPAVIRFSRNGQVLLTGGGMGGKSGQAVLWNVLNGDRIGVVGDEADQVLAADISPDQGHVALGGPTRVLKIYATKDGQLEHSIKKHTDWITAIAFSPDGKYLASADRNGGIVVWEGASGNEFNVLPGHKAMVSALAFMPGILASGSEDGRIVLWDVKEAKEIKSWNAHGGGVASVDFTADGRLVSCGRDRVAKVWDKDGNLTTTSEPLTDIAVRAALSGERVIAGDWSGAIKVFGLDGKPVGELTSNPVPIADHLAVAGKRLAESEAARPGLLQALEEATKQVAQEEAEAEARQKEALTAAELRKQVASEKLAMAKAAPEQTEKALTDAREKLEVAKRERDQAGAARKQTEQFANEKAQAQDPAAVAAVKDAENAKAAFDLAEGAVEVRSQEVEKLAGELDRIRAEAPAQLAGLEKEIDEANAAISKLSAPPAPLQPAPDEARIADLSRKLQDLNQEITRRREDRAKKQNTPEYEAANKAVQDIKPQIDAVSNDLETAKKTLVSPPASPAEQQLAKAKQALDRVEAEIGVAKAGADRWTKAESYMGVYRAGEALRAKEEQYQELLAMAKGASQPVEMAKSKVVDLGKRLEEAPALQDEKRALQAKAEEAVKAATENVAAAEKRVQEKEAELAAGADLAKRTAELQAKLDQLNQEIAKRREHRAQVAEGTPEYAQANEQVQNIKPEIAETEKALAAVRGSSDDSARKALEMEIARQREMVTISRAEMDAAVKSSEKAAAEVAAALATEDKLKEELAQVRAKIPELEISAEAARTEAETKAAAMAMELDKARAEAERVRVEYEARWLRPANPEAKEVAASGG